MYVAQGSPHVLSVEMDPAPGSTGGDEEEEEENLSVALGLGQQPEQEADPQQQPAPGGAIVVSQHAGGSMTQVTLPAMTVSALDDSIDWHLGEYFRAHIVDRDQVATQRLTTILQVLAVFKLRSIVMRADFWHVGSGGHGEGMPWSDPTFRFELRDGLAAAGCLGSVSNTVASHDTRRFRAQYSTFNRPDSRLGRMLQSGVHFLPGSVSAHPCLQSC